MNIITKWPSGLVYSAPERPKWLAGTKCRRFDLSSLSSLYNPVFPSSLSTAVAGEMPSACLDTFRAFAFEITFIRIN